MANLTPEQEQAAAGSPSVRRAGLIARYRAAHRRYHELVAERSARYREFDEAATTLFFLTSEIGLFNREHPEAKIDPLPT
jgi:hypothetical protein